MNQEIINLFDEYTHKPLKRELFLKKLVQLVGSTAAAMAILPILEGSYAAAAIIKEEDPDLLIENITFEGPNGPMMGYLVKPKIQDKPKGAVMVIHENRGLTPHIQDVTRRIAKAGFVALGIDALSPFGGTPANEDEGRTLIGKLDAAQNLANLKSGIAYLRKLAGTNGKTATVGFCWGGAMVNALAVADPDLNGGVAYYGRQPDAEGVKNIRAKLLLHYAGLDERVNAGMQAYEEALKNAKIDYEQYVYEGAQHAFNNDSSPARYQAETAQLAWGRTLAFFEKVLG